MTPSRAQIVATVGPACSTAPILQAMIEHQMDIARINFSWIDQDQCSDRVLFIKAVMEQVGRKIPIMLDLPGPRIQKSDGHTYDASAPDALTEKDLALIECAISQQVDYIALSFVSGPKEIEQCREVIKKNNGSEKIIAKIERKVAVDNLDAIMAVADAVMIARGDLGEELPLEQIPFVQSEIINKCNAKGLPVIVATQMLLSMVQNPEPTRAEVTDVATAILEGADAVMLSDETAIGKYPVEAIIMMEKIVVEAERHLEVLPFHPL